MSEQWIYERAKAAKEILEDVESRATQELREGISEMVDTMAEMDDLLRQAQKDRDLLKELVTISELHTGSTTSDLQLKDKMLLVKEHITRVKQHLNKDQEQKEVGKYYHNRNA